MRTTNIKFTGLASGLDTESMIQAMVAPYKSKVDSAVQQQKLMELKKDAWRDMNTKIYKFYNETLGPLRLEGTFNAKEVTVSKPGIVEIGSNGGFPDGTHTIKDVELASGARLETSQINQDKGAKLVADLGIPKDTKINVSVNGASTPIEITVDDDMTLEGLAKKLKDAGLSANYDSNAGAFFISSKETGANQKIEITSTGDTLHKLGLVKNAGETSTGLVHGEDAKLNYNGIPITSSTNVVKVNGMDIKLLSSSTEEINIVSKTDTDAIIEKITGFVDAYNELIEEMNGKISAPYNKDYLPLTDEQKKAMSEDDIKLWNEKVEKSILRKDPVLQSIVSSMRDIIGGTSVDVDGKKYDLSSFGITTSLNYKEGGKLYIDQDKFKEGISKNPDIFKQLFTNKVEATGGLTEKEALAKSGVGVRLYADITDRLKGSTMKSSNFLFNDKDLDNKIKSQKSEVSKLEERMYRMEGLYYKQFASMEKMLGQLNNQSNWLMGQLGGM